MITKECIVCNNSFKVDKYRSTTAKYCNRKCKVIGSRGIRVSRETEFTSERMKGNNFRLGKIPWNKGTKGIMKPNKTSFKKEQFIGEKNVQWKGNKVGYYALHSWVHRRLGKPKICKKCKSTKNVEWANKSHKYKRKITDWLSLCHRCHFTYDKNFWGIARRYIQNGRIL